MGWSLGRSGRFTLYQNKEECAGGEAPAPQKFQIDGGCRHHRIRDSKYRDGRLCQAEASWQCVHIRSQVDAIIIMTGEVGLAANES